MSYKFSFICCIRPWRPRRLSNSVAILGPRIMIVWEENYKLGCHERCILEYHMWWLSRLWVGLKVHVYGFQRDGVLSPLLSFFINAIETRWENNGMLHMDHFYRFLHCCHVPVDVPVYRPYIVDFYVWWTQPTPSYYHFIVPMPKVLDQVASE